MSIFINFVTMVAWAWAGLAAIGVLISLWKMATGEGFESMMAGTTLVWSILVGIIPVLWLVARYLL